MTTFKSFALSKQMTTALEELGYKSPSKVQELVIPHVLKRESLVVTSETGSGKTHSFLVPIIDSLDFSLNQIQAIIIAPTRELAKQTYDFARAFKEYFPNLRIALLTSQVEKSKNENKLSNAPQIIVATPGRLLDLGITNNVANLSTTKFIVLDEADMLMDSGFLDDINTLLSNLEDATKLVFSATINSKLSRLIEKYIGAEHVITLDNYTNANVKHYAIDIRHKDILEATKDFIDETEPYFLLVFASRINDVKRIYEYLKTRKYNVTMIHGDLEKRERKNVMKRINAMEFQIVVCSDMASRGLDIDNVSDVLNVDLPKDLSFYFHRAGRTGRFNNVGNCFTFYNDDATESILKLIDMNVKFDYLVLKNGELKEGKEIVKVKRKHKNVDEALDRDIRRAVIETRKKKVKPGYKKAVRVAVEKVKRKHHRQKIKEDIRKQRVKRYKEEARRNG